MELVIFAIGLYIITRVLRAARARSAKVATVWYDGVDRTGIDRQLASAAYRGWSSN